MAMTPAQKRDLRRARESLLHGLANSIAVMVANAQVVRHLGRDPSLKDALDDLVLAAGKAKREIEALRALEPPRRRSAPRVTSVQGE